MNGPYCQTFPFPQPVVLARSRSTRRRATRLGLLLASASWLLLFVPMTGNAAETRSTLAQADSPGIVLPEADDQHKDLTALLSSLMQEAESRQLAGKLKQLIDRGDVKAAEILLAGAIEQGTLAALLVDRIHDPALIEFLRNQKLPAAANETEQPAVSGPDPAAIEELRTGLEQERARAEQALRELDALRSKAEQELAAARESAARDIAAAREEAARERAALEQKSAQETASLKEAASREAASAAEAMQKLEALKESAARELATVKENAARDITAAREAARERSENSAREFAAVKENAAQEIAAAKENAAREIAAIRETAMRERQAAEEKAAAEVTSLKEKAVRDIAVAAETEREFDAFKQKAAQELAAAKEDAAREIAEARTTIERGRSDDAAQEIATIKANATRAVAIVREAAARERDEQIAREVEKVRQDAAQQVASIKDNTAREMAAREAALQEKAENAARELDSIKEKAARELAAAKESAAREIAAARAALAGERTAIQENAAKEVASVREEAAHRAAAAAEAAREYAALQGQMHAPASRRLIAQVFPLAWYGPGNSAFETVRETADPAPSNQSERREAQPQARSMLFLAGAAGDAGSGAQVTARDQVSAEVTPNSRVSAAQAPAAPNADRARSAPPPAPSAEERIFARVAELLRTGDISGARLLLEHAMQSGSARAIFGLAETYDPEVLSRLGVLGIRGDPARARELYARARAAGYQQAQGPVGATR